MATLTSSGTYNFQLANSDVVLEAYERIQIRPAEITAEHMHSANRSANLELQTWANRGVTLYAVEQATPITLIEGQATYTLPTNCIQMLDTYYSVLNSDGVTYTDRIMLPMSRTEYAEIPQKSIQAPPNRYWFDRAQAPTVTTWQVYDGSSPGALMNYFYLRQLQDVNLLGTEAPDMLNRFLEAFIAGITARLAEKWLPAVWADKKAAAAAAWAEASKEDREQGGMTIRPNFARYMRRR
jgi:hypothetical protein